MRTALPALAAALEDTLGRKPALAMSGVVAADDATVRADLTASGFGIRFTLSDQPGVVLLTRGPARLLARTKQGEDTAAIEAALADEAELADVERATLTEMAPGLTEAFVALLGSCTTADSAVAAGKPSLLVESAWEDGDDPLPTGALTIATLTLGFEGIEPVPILIAIPAGVAESSFLHEAPATTGGGWIELVMSSDVREKIAAVVGSGRPVERVADFVSAWSSDDAVGGFVQVGAEQEHILSLLGSLRRFPGCEDKPLIVLLDQPTVLNVVACGRLRLFSVVGSDCAPEDLARRVEEARTDHGP